MRLRLSKNYLLFFFFFILGIVLSYIYHDRRAQATNEVTKDIILNAIDSVEASQALSEACTMAYDSVTRCVGYFSTCDLTDLGEKMDSFNRIEKQSIQKRQKAYNELQLLLNQITK